MSTLADASMSPAAGGLAVLAVRGPDAAKFLQGQLSADTEKLAPGSSTLAGLHNPQGRVVAILSISRTSPDEFLAALPRELVATVAQRLRRFVLRSRVRIEDGPDTARQASELEAVRQGVPQVYAATSEQFVAQMLNLDLLGAIAFDKGCYTGQEVIARAHYRGRVKRRMQRWRNSSGTELKPGDNALGPDGRSLIVVRTASAESGQELLAVGTFGDGEAGPAAAAGDTRGVMLAGPLPLPYVLPD